MFSVYITATLPCQLEGKCPGRLDLVSSGGRAVGTRQGRARLERQPAQWPPSLLLLIGPLPIQMGSQPCFKCGQASWRHRWHSTGQGYVSSACQDLQVSAHHVRAGMQAVLQTQCSPSPPPSSSPQTESIQTHCLNSKDAFLRREIHAWDASRDILITKLWFQKVCWGEEQSPSASIHHSSYSCLCPPLPL